MSEQMDNLLRDYGVQTEAQLIRAIQDEYEQETGERPSKEVAEVLLDRMLEAEYQRIAGGWTPVPPEPEARPEEESYEGWETRDPIEVYGTPEHEAWLIEMEAREG